MGFIHLLMQKNKASVSMKILKTYFDVEYLRVFCTMKHIHMLAMYACACFS
jgi:hypothetical protein